MDELLNNSQPQEQKTRYCFMQRLFLFLISFSTFCSFSQTTGYLTCMGSRLRKFDLSACESQMIGTSQNVMYDIALTPSGRVFGTDSDSLYEISTSDASIVNAWELFPIAGVNSLLALNDDLLIFLKAFDLYTFNLNTGEKKYIGSLGYGSSGDITHYKGHYYVCTTANELVRFKLNDDFTELRDIKVIGSLDTPEKMVFGILTLGTLTCEKDDLKIYAFEGWNVYEVDPQTAHCTLTCDSISPSGVWGAASVAETSFAGEEAYVEMTNVFTPDNNQINDVYFPYLVSNVQSADFTILNRWGNPVFQSKDTDILWDGRSIAGEDCTAGVYFYLVETTDFCNRKKRFDGFLTLIR